MENKLVRIDEFREVLANYAPSSSIVKTLNSASLVLLMGPTASGRNTVIEELVKTGGYYHIISDTTRKKRVKDGHPIEQNGREYWFRSEADVLADLEKGEYIEAAVIHNQQISGCNIREIKKANDARRVAIKDIEPGGVTTFHRLKSDTTIIFLMPPNYDEWLRRLHSRGELHEEEINRRLTSAAKEFEAALANDYYQFVVNTTVSAAVEQVENIVKTGHQTPELQTAARQLATEILDELGT